MSDDRLRVLLVSAQFPYPATFGYATRVYQLARHLAAGHQVTLLSYVQPDEHDAVERLRLEIGVEAVLRQPPSLAAKRTAQLVSLASRRPFQSRLVTSREMQQTIDTLCSNQRFDVIQLETSLMCTFRFPTEAVLVIDEHNIEYEVFQRMQEGERSRLRRAFNRLEHYRFRSFEQTWWRRAGGCVLTSDREELIVRREAPRHPHQSRPQWRRPGVFFAAGTRDRSRLDGIQRPPPLPPEP